MVKSNHVVLLKAVAMGALLTNGNIGSEGENKQGKALNHPMYATERMGGRLTNTNIACRVNEILSEGEERKAIRRGLLQQLRLFDLSVKPVGDVLEFLGQAHKHSGQDPIKVKLNLLNVAPAQLNAILTDENAIHIGELEFSEQPVVTSDQGTGKEDKKLDKIPDTNRADRILLARKILDQIDKRTQGRQEILKQRRTIDLGVKPVSNVLNVLHYAHKYSGKEPIKVKLNLLNVTEEQLDKILNDENAPHIEELEWTYPPKEKEEKAYENMAVSSAVTRIPDQADERTKLRHKALSHPRLLDLSVKPAGDVLGFLYEAHKYTVKVNPNLPHVREGQLNAVFNNENANPVRQIERAYQPIPLAILRDARNNREGAEVARERQPVHQPIPIVVLRDAGNNEEGGELARERQPVHQPVPVAVLRDAGNNEEGGELARERQPVHQPVPVAVLRDAGNNEEGGEVAGEGQPVHQPIPIVVLRDRENEELNEDMIAAEAGNNNADEVAGEGQPVHWNARDIAKPQLKRSAARRREAPLLTELDKNIGKKGNIEPENRFIINPFKTGSDDKMKPLLSSWKITPAKEGISNTDPQDLGGSNMYTAQASHNLVSIYCRKAPAMVMAH